MKIGFFTLFAIGILAGCNAGQEKGPAALVRHLMSEIYSVKPDTVVVDVTFGPGKKDAFAITESGLYACQMGISQDGVFDTSPFGWFVTSVQCDLKECEPGVESEDPEAEDATCASGAPGYIDEYKRKEA